MTVSKADDKCAVDCLACLPAVVVLSAATARGVRSGRTVWVRARSVGIREDFGERTHSLHRRHCCCCPSRLWVESRISIASLKGEGDHAQPPLLGVPSAKADRVSRPSARSAKKSSQPPPPPLLEFPSVGSSLQSTLVHLGERRTASTPASRRSVPTRRRAVAARAGGAVCRSNTIHQRTGS